MYLSDRDLEFAVRTGQLIVDPPPLAYDTTSIGLHLDSIDKAKIWDIASFEKDQEISGQSVCCLGVGQFQHQAFAKKFHIPIPEQDPSNSNQLVFRHGQQILIKPRGFFLWQTKEDVGTPEENPRLICFIDGKSSAARTGLLVHLTAPTIHSGWWGKVTLEISNLGPFTLSLRENDAVAQIVVATISSPPVKRKAVKGVSVGAQGVGGD